MSCIRHALAFWTVVPLSIAAGAPTDVAGIVVAGAVCWAANLGVLALVFVASERWGAMAVFLAAWVWQGVGVLAAEWGSWGVVPPTWAVRAMLPLLGAYQNARPLDPGDPLALESPLFAVCLGLGLMAQVVLVRLTIPPGTLAERRTDARPIGRRSLRPGAFGAVDAVMRGRPVLALSVAAIGLCTAIAIAYPQNYLLGLHTCALLPIGVSVAAVLLWQSIAPGWRLLVLRRSAVPAAVRLWLVVCVSCVTGVVAALAIVSALLHGSDTAGVVDTLRSATLWLLLGAGGALGALWATVRFGTGWALGGAVVAVVVGATVGGDVLADTWLWVLAPTSWPLIADTPARFATAVSVVLVAASALWMSSGRALVDARVGYSQG